jgi:hypothetical protein
MLSQIDRDDFKANMFSYVQIIHFCVNTRATDVCIVVHVDKREIQ